MEKSVLDDYNSADGAAGYTQKFDQDWIERINNVREQRLIRELLSDLPRPNIALDMPSGYGRLYPLLQDVSDCVVEGDWSFYMLRESKKRWGDSASQQPRGYVRATAFQLPYADRTFGLVFSARLCHHISSLEERRQYVREIMRISDDSVVFTYFDSASIKNRVHKLKRRFVEKTPKWTLGREDIAQLAAEAGFEVLRAVPLSRLFSGHCYTMMRRKERLAVSRPA